MYTIMAGTDNSKHTYDVPGYVEISPLLTLVSRKKRLPGHNTYKYWIQKSCTAKTLLNVTLTLIDQSINSRDKNKLSGYSSIE